MYREISATTTIVLGDASMRDVSRWIVQFTGSDTPSYSIAVNKRVTRISDDGGAVGGWVAGYYLLDADGTATSGAVSVTTTTPTIITIDASGMDVELVCTKTTGTLAVRAVAIRG